jgi:hypothetical protein
MVNPPRVWLGGVKAGEGLGAGSLILTPNGFFACNLPCFLRGGWSDDDFTFASPSSRRPGAGTF